jgi:hypothetical protein
LSRGNPIAIGRLQPTVGLLLSLLDDSDIPPGTVELHHVSDCTRLAAALSVEEQSDLSNGGRDRRSSLDPMPDDSTAVAVAPRSRLICRLAIITSRKCTVQRTGELNFCKTMRNNYKRLLKIKQSEDVEQNKHRSMPNWKIQFCLTFCLTYFPIVNHETNSTRSDKITSFTHRLLDNSATTDRRIGRSGHQMHIACASAL